MRVVKIPVQVQPHAKQKTQSHKIRNTIFFMCLLLAVAWYQLQRPLPAPVATLSIARTVPALQDTVDSPTYGQSALYVDGYGIVKTTGVQEHVSTASIAKVITALCVLERKPLKLGEAGPRLVMGRDDYSLYQQEIMQNGSLLPIYQGMELTQYNALQAIMIPSANNIANSLAIWAFGSLEAYSEYANNFAMRHGLVNTRIGNDASGYDASSVSNASDLVRLGAIVAKNPVLMEIAAQKEADFPFSGTLYNYNRALGFSGINGLKTGNNSQNLGGLLMTGNTQVNGKKVFYSGTVLGASSLSEAIDDSKNMATSISSNFQTVPIVRAKEKVATVTTAWGERAEIVSQRSVSATRWVNHAVNVSLIAPTSANDAGSLVISVNGKRSSNPVSFQQPIEGPSLWWRLSRR
jgi:serine-type D-Ala-D-Ala carboxypeptidase (penicillin-binding protein 5/6)